MTGVQRPAQQRFPLAAPSAPLHPLSLPPPLPAVSYPLPDLFAESSEDDSERGSGSGDERGQAAEMRARLAAQAQQAARLEGVVGGQALRIAQVSA